MSENATPRPDQRDWDTEDDGNWMAEWSGSDLRELVRERKRLLRIEEAARFRASVTFTNLDPQPEGPDLLDAIAAYMDRQDNALEERTGVTPDRSVQVDVREWARELREALGDPR